MIRKLKRGNNKMTQKRCSSLLLHSGLPSPATTSLRIPSSQTVSSPLTDPSLLPTKALVESAHGIEPGRPSSALIPLLFQSSCRHNIQLPNCLNSTFCAQLQSSECPKALFTFTLLYSPDLVIIAHCLCKLCLINLVCTFLQAPGSS